MEYLIMVGNSSILGVYIADPRLTNEDQAEKVYF